MAIRHSLFVLLFIAAVCLYIGRKTSVYFDDVYITLTYSRMLAEGHGMVFRPGEHVQGTTTPLWCWLNAAAMSAGVSGQAGCKALFLAATWAAGFALFRFGRALGRPAVGALAGLLYPLAAPHVGAFGSETSLCVWLALETMIAYRVSPRRAGFFCGLLLLARLDGGVVFLLIQSAYLIKRRWRDAARFAAVASACIVPWLIFAWWYYGSPLPNTLTAKQAQLELARQSEVLPWIRSVPRGTWDYSRNFVQKSPWILVAVTFLGAFLSLFRLREEWLLLAWPMGQIAGYSLLGVAYYDWYLYPIWALLAWAGARGCGAILFDLSTTKTQRHKEERAEEESPEISDRDGFDTRPRPRLPWVSWRLGDLAVHIRRVIFVGLAAAALLAARRPWWGDPAQSQRLRYEGYLQVAIYLRENASEQDTVLCSEIGVMGFASPTRIADLAGLVHRAPTAQNIYNKEALIARVAPEFILESWSAAPENAELFAQARRGDFAMTFSDADGRPAAYHQVFYTESPYSMRVLLRRAS